MLSAYRLPNLRQCRLSRGIQSISELQLRRTVIRASRKDGGVSGEKKGEGEHHCSIHFPILMQSELKGLEEPMVDTVGLTDMARQMLEEDPDMQALLKSYQEAMLRVDRQAPLHGSYHSYGYS